MSVHTRYVQSGALWVPEYTARSRGLGDLVARGLSAVGIRQTPGCGCPKRQAALNRLMPFQSEPRRMARAIGGGAGTLYYNSSETGCNPASPGAGVVMCEDFSTLDNGPGTLANRWYYADGDDTAEVNTKGWVGSIFTRKDISAATNASPIVVTTSSAHGYTTGDRVAIYSCAGNTAANGTWTVTVNNSTEFQLQGSTGNGTYSGFGHSDNYTPRSVECGGAGPGGSGPAGANCIATSGPLPGPNPDFTGLCADHNFAPSVTAYSQIWLRFYIKYSAGHTLGPMKTVTYNHHPAGNAGITVGGFGNGAGEWAILPADHHDETNVQNTGCPGGNNVYLCQNQGVNLGLLATRGRWLYMEHHIKMNTGSTRNGEWDMWVNDCGTSGICAGSPILRSHFTNVRWTDVTDTVQSFWYENQSNPAVSGQQWMAWFKVSTAGQIGFVGAPSEIPVSNTVAIPWESGIYNPNVNPRGWHRGLVTMPGQRAASGLVR